MNSKFKSVLNPLTAGQVRQDFGSDLQLPLPRAERVAQGHTIGFVIRTQRLPVFNPIS